MSQVELAVQGLRFDAVLLGPEHGPLVVALHGFPESKACWLPVARRWAEAGYRVLVPDQRGLSPGARPAGVAPYRVRELVADVVAMADELGAERLAVAGSDLGATVAWHLGGRLPERVAAVVALGTPHPEALTEALGKDPDQRNRFALMRELRVEPRLEHSLLRDDAAGLRGMALLSGYPTTSAALELLDATLARLTEPDALSATLGWYRAISREEAVDAIGVVSVPVLFLWGDADVLVGPWVVGETRDVVAGPYELRVLPGVGHWLLEEVPEAVADWGLRHLLCHFPVEGGSRVASGGEEMSDFGPCSRST